MTASPGALSRPGPTSTSESTAGGRVGFRTDIQGLRAVAVGLVLIYHAGAPFLPGGYTGVDIFFVISGFLITGLLLREIRETGRLSLGGFYARRVRRILPAATTVLVFVAASTVLILPPTRWEDIGWHTIGSAVYAVNWVFAASSVDYLASDDAASPLQHFWTLAVEEQYYIVWPLLLVVLIGLSRRPTGASGERGRRRTHEKRLHRWVILGVLLVTVPSLIWSISYTGAVPDRAYFVTTTRLWELGVGATVAVFAPALGRLPQRLAVGMGWVGLGGIVAAGVLYSSATPFPGYAALLPTLGAAAVLIAGMDGRSRRGVGAVLSVRPMVFVGGVSYSLYLWHWPLIVVASYVVGGLSFAQGLLVVGASFLPAYLSFRYVETRFQRSPRLSGRAGLTLWVGGGMVAVGAVAGMVLLLLPSVISAAPLNGTRSDGNEGAPPLGAEQLMNDPSAGVARDTVESITPTPVAAADDNAPVYEDGCHQHAQGTDVEPCVYGDPASDITVALVGDSHAAQWVPALRALADDGGWRLETYTKSACPLAGVMVGRSGSEDSVIPYTECQEWNSKVMAVLTGAAAPDVVITTHSRYAPIVDGDIVEQEGRAEVLGRALGRSWQALTSADVPVVVLRDTPWMGVNVPECVSTNMNQLTACAVDRHAALVGYETQNIAARGLDDVAIVDMNDMICPADRCAPVIGGVLVYRDTNHITATYARSLASPLRERLVETGLFPSTQ